MPHSNRPRQPDRAVFSPSQVYTLNPPISTLPGTLDRPATLTWGWENSIDVRFPRFAQRDKPLSVGMTGASQP